MTEITVYETPNTLTLSYFSIVNEVNIVSDRKHSLKPEMLKAKSWRTIKFSVFNGLLFVNYGRYSHVSKPQGGRVRVPRPHSERMIPEAGGIVISYIKPDTIPVITAFLNRHFPGIETKPMNYSEQHTIFEDLNFYGKDINDETKLDIAALCTRIHGFSFPVFGDFIPNRISDGYYVENKSGWYPKKYHRAKTYREFLTELFGTYRKDLAKVVATSSPSVIQWSAGFKDFLDVDTIINGMREAKNTTCESAPSLDVLVDFPKNAVKKLFLEGLNVFFDYGWLEDSIEMAPWVPADERKLCTSWRELHDRGMANYASHEDGEKEISHTDDFERFFEKSEFEGHTVQPMRNAKSFVDTGHSMDVCVGSRQYITRAFQGQGFCFRLDNTENNPYALVEVRRSSRDTEKWHVAQIRGVKNSILPDKLNTKISEELSKYITLENRR